MALEREHEGFRVTTQLPEFLGGPMLGPVCPSPLFGRAGILVPDTPAELAANGHGHHGEGPELGRGPWIMGFILPCHAV